MAKTKKPREEVIRAPKKLEVTEFDMALLNVSAGLAPEGVETGGLSQWADCEWLDISDNRYAARVTMSMLLDWEEGLLIELSYIVEFVAGESVTRGDIEAACSEVMMPVWNDAAYVSAFITDRFIGMPLILPQDVKEIKFSGPPEDGADEARDKDSDEG